MASDDDYAAFLDKANQDTGSAQAQSSSKWVSTKTKDTEIPKILSGTEVFYQSETDEPFEPVALKYDREELPGTDDFKQLIDFNGEIEQLREEDFDPKGTYKEIIDVVKKAGTDKIAVFRAEHGVSRAQYYVVSVDKKGEKLVGMVAAAVET